MDADELIHLVSSKGGEPRTGQHTGTKALMLAVLEDGIRSYLGPAGRVRTEAERWITTGKGRSPFSFITICETLGLEPDAVRRALAKLESRKPSRRALGRFRGNVRHTRLGAAS